MRHSYFKILQHYLPARAPRKTSTGLVLFACLSLGYYTPAFAVPQNWSSLLQRVSTAPKTIISLKMQQIHSFNFMLDPRTWQMKDIHTFEDSDRYEFSKNFKCISSLCSDHTALSLTLVTYKYGTRLFSPTQLEKSFPIAKWRKIFEKGQGITAKFQNAISVPSRLNHMSYGYRYHDLKMNDKTVHGKIDLLYYAQSQVRLIISSPKTKQEILEKLLKTIEQTMTLQQLR